MNAKLIHHASFVAMLTTLTACGGGDTPATSESTGGAGQPGTGGGQLTQLETDLLTSVNSYRAQARACGSLTMPAVGAVQWNELLEATAQGHSEYMKNTETFDHVGQGGSTVGQRATAQGYDWGSIGENIAAGYPSVAAVMQGWINSPGHCQNIMAADFTEFAVTKVLGDAGNTYSDYWTMVLGTPR